VISADHQHEEAGHKPGGARNARQVQAIGFLVLVGVILAAFAILYAQQFKEGRALLLNGEGGIWTGFLLPVALMVCAATLWVFSLCVGIYRLIKFQIEGVVYFAGLALISVAFSYLGHFYIVGVRENFSSIDEPRYLLLASQTRELLEVSKAEVINLREIDDPSGKIGDNLNAVAFSKLLDGSVLAHWPKNHTYVFVHPDSVWIMRGGGMTGRIGVQIFDRGVAPSARLGHESKDGDVTRYYFSPRVAFTSGD
jgi:hypothetical protein